MLISHTNILGRSPKPVQYLSAEVTLRLFEDEVTATIATDGPCEVLGVEQRTEYLAERFGPQRVRQYGAVVFRAEARMYPKIDERTGQWAVPPTAKETRLILMRASLRGNELPPSAGRFLGSYTEEGERWFAFLAKDVRESRRPEGSEAPKAAGAPAPGKAEGPSPAASAKAPPERQPQAAQPSTHRSNAQHGRQ